MKKIILTLLLLAVGVSGAQASQILGAGATFPYPFYAKLFDEYNKATRVQVNYQSIGSGGGIRQIINKTVDFGASDAPMSDSALREIPSKLVHIPTCMGAVVISYNLPGDPKVRFTGDVIANIFMGKIIKWNDSRIQDLNPTISLPDLPIVFVHRSDGSGTTAIATDYLCKVSPVWDKRIGKGTSVNWPAGLGAKGNEGVAGLVKSTPGSIGYIELVYAMQNGISYGSVKNSAGMYVTPTLQTITAAGVVEVPSDTRVSLTNGSPRYGYPISGFTWLLVYQDQDYGNRTYADAQQLVKLLWWVLHEGQGYADDLKYGKLPQNVQKKAEMIIKSITFGEKPLRL